jgi:uncharacterized protein DUF4112
MTSTERSDSYGRAESTHEARLRRARAEMQTLAWLLDGTFRIPGTRFRFGLDPIIGLVPAAGDLVSGAVGVYLIARAVQFRLPLIVVARMVVNTALDFVVGVVPVLGDLFDFAYRSNARNMRLFEEYITEPDRGTGSQWLFFAALLGVLLVAILLVGEIAGPLLGELDRALRNFAELIG